MIRPEEALPGRAEPMAVAEVHPVLGTPLVGPWSEGHEVMYFAMGCFWGADRIMWQIPGVHSTACGYMGGWTPNPTYEETCTSQTGHTEIVMVVFDPNVANIETCSRRFGRTTTRPPRTVKVTTLALSTGQRFIRRPLVN